MMSCTINCTKSSNCSLVSSPRPLRSSQAAIGTGPQYAGTNDGIKTDEDKRQNELDLKELEAKYPIVYNKVKYKLYGYT